MSTPNEIKKNIAKDWNKAFPELSIFAQNKLYKIIGPIVAGIELINLPRSDDYRPHFVIYPIWKASLSDCFSFPIMLTEFQNKKGLQFDISYSNHSSYFDEVKEYVKNQIPISFQKNLPISDLLSTLYEYSKKHNARFHLSDAELHKFTLYCALYVNDIELTTKIYNDIMDSPWNVNHFARCKVNFGNWVQEIENTLSNRDQFMAQIATNKGDKKMKKLQQSELLP